MEGRQLLTRSATALTVLALAGSASAQSTRSAAGDGLITVMNPSVANQMVERAPLSPRLDTLEGKKLYMVDIGWGGPDAAYSVFEQMEIWFAENMPSVETVIKRKRGSYMVGDPALWPEIKDNGGDAVIVGISG